VKVGIVKKAIEDFNTQHKLRVNLLPLYEYFEKERTAIRFNV
jgi:hypothetical protein